MFLSLQGKQDTRPGHLHPLMQLRSEFRQIFLEMGFSEMPTNSFVESAFWNFDALFQPQQHPARDAHDTFYVKTPGRALSVPQDYMKRVHTLWNLLKEKISSKGFLMCNYRNYLQYIVVVIVFKSLKLATCGLCFSNFIRNKMIEQIN